MQSQGFAVILAFLGLAALLSFAQTYKHGSINRYAQAVGMLIIPIAIAIIWRLGTIFGWWTIAIFIVVSLLVGSINAFMIRKSGLTSLFSLQPLLGTVALIAAAGSWVA
ncbi:hypothetical protein ACBQ21_08965 [Pseudomonas putida]|uniref:hypothetical protein n=1 Tax=Pseudomonas putida TaxID=303 RepID=UPI0035245B88